MEEKALKIINKFGIENQLKKFNEENYELQEAIIQYEKGCGTYKHVVEEIVDNLVLLKQFILFYGIPKEMIEEGMKFKIDRTIERIEVGFYGKGVRK